MTADAAKPRAKVRKIFKKGDNYLCGLCGKTYKSIPEAETCLKADSRIMLAEAGGQEVAPKRYRCSICRRIHDSMDAAKSCALACKQIIEKRAAAEERAQRSTSLEEKLRMLEKFAKDPGAIAALKATQAQVQAAAPIALGTFKPKSSAILPGENVKFQREKNQFRCLKCRQKYSAADDARQCFDAHGDRPINPSKATSSDHRYTLDKNKFRCSKCERLYQIAADASNCWESHSPQPVEKRREEETSQAFYRDGAKYICRKCNRKYFSRDEVMACFEGPHTDMPATEEAITEPPEIKEALAPKINKKDDAEKFYRDGAKYVCRGCNKKYFSRDETLACFENDPKDDVSTKA